jgi:hypothetical protein
MSKGEKIFVASLFAYAAIVLSSAVGVKALSFEVKEDERAKAYETCRRFTSLNGVVLETDDAFICAEPVYRVDKSELKK